MRFSSVQFLHSRQCWGVGHWVPSLETALAVCQCLCSVLPQAWCDLVGFGTRRWSMHDIPAPLPHAMISNMHDGLCALATVVCHFISVFQHVCVSMCVSLRICVWMWISRFPIYDTWIQMTLVKVGELGRGSRFSGDWLSWLEWWRGRWRQAALCNFRGLRNTLSNHTSLLLLPKEWNWDSCIAHASSCHCHCRSSYLGPKVGIKTWTAQRMCICTVTDLVFRVCVWPQGDFERMFKNTDEMTKPSLEIPTNEPLRFASLPSPNSWDETQACLFDLGCCSVVLRLRRWCKSEMVFWRRTDQDSYLQKEEEIALIALTCLILSVAMPQFQVISFLPTVYNM